MTSPFLWAVGGCGDCCDPCKTNCSTLSFTWQGYVLRDTPSPHTGTSVTFRGSIDDFNDGAGTYVVEFREPLDIGWGVDGGAVGCGSVVARWRRSSQH